MLIKSSKQKLNFFPQFKQGMAALITVIIVSVAVLIIAYNVSMLGIGELGMGYTAQKGSEALSVADGCMEEIFRQIKLSVTPSSSLSVGNGSCIISIVADGNDRTITVTASTTDDHYKKIEVNATLSSDAVPIITINSWAELSS